MTLERLIRVAQTALEGSEADLGHVTAQTRLQEALGFRRADARCAGACAAQRVLPPRHLHRKR